MEQHATVAPQSSVKPSLKHWLRAVPRPRLRIIPEGLILVLLVMLFGSLVIESVSPHDPLRGNPADRLMAPSIHLKFWEGHLLGTDQQGRDIFTRLLVGTRYSLLVAGIAVGVAGSVGLVLGMVAGSSSGAVDTIIMRVCDAVLALPIIVLAMLFAGIFGPSLTLVSLTLASQLWAYYARMVRGETLSVVQRDFVKLARVAGASRLRIIFVHILPHVTSTFMVLLTLQVGSAILAESSLSFLGAGVPPPAPAWGSMAAMGRPYLSEAWWVSLFPGLAVALIVLCFNMVGDWVRDRLDPTLQR